MTCDNPAGPIVHQSTTTITTALSALQIAVGTTAFDTATIVGATALAGGTVTYSVFSDLACTFLAFPAAPADVKTVTDGRVEPSNEVLFADPGTFYWRAVYSGDADNLGSTSPCRDEVLTVTVDQPT